MPLAYPRGVPRMSQGCSWRLSVNPKEVPWGCKGDPGSVQGASTSVPVEPWLFRGSDTAQPRSRYQDKSKVGKEVVGQKRATRTPQFATPPPLVTHLYFPPRRRRGFQMYLGRWLRLHLLCEPGSRCPSMGSRCPGGSRCPSHGLALSRWLALPEHGLALSVSEPTPNLHRTYTAIPRPATRKLQTCLQLPRSERFPCIVTPWCVPRPPGGRTEASAPPRFRRKGEPSLSHAGDSGGCAGRYNPRSSVASVCTPTRGSWCVYGPQARISYYMISYYIYSAPMMQRGLCEGDCTGRGVGMQFAEKETFNQYMLGPVYVFWCRVFSWDLGSIFFSFDPATLFS